MQKYDPSQFHPNIHGIKVVFGTDPPLSKEQCEQLLANAVSYYLEEGLAQTEDYGLLGPDGRWKFDFYFDTGEFDFGGDPRPPVQQIEDAARADEFAEKGTLKHYLLKRGFFPDNEEVAEAILDNIIRGNEGR